MRLSVPKPCELTADGLAETLDEGHHRHHRHHADDDAERGEETAQLVGADGVEGGTQAFSEGVHGYS